MGLTAKRGLTRPGQLALPPRPRGHSTATDCCRPAWGRALCRIMAACAGWPPATRARDAHHEGLWLRVQAAPDPQPHVLAQVTGSLLK